MKRKYYKEHLLDIVKREHIDKDILIDCLRVILDNAILDRSCEDLEINMDDDSPRETEEDDEN